MRHLDSNSVKHPRSAHAWAVNCELLHSVVLAPSSREYRWHFDAHEDRSVRWPRGVGQDLEVRIQTTEACSGLRLLANGQIITAEAPGAAADRTVAVFRLRDLPAGPLVLEVEGVSKTPLPSAVPYPWELSTRYARPAAAGNDVARTAHRAVMTMCVLVEPAAGA